MQYFINLLIEILFIFSLTPPLSRRRERETRALTMALSRKREREGPARAGG